MLGGGSGIGRYISELSHEILKQDKRNQYVLFFNQADKSADYGIYGHKIVITGIPHYSFSEQLKLPGILKKERLDLVHFPHFNVPIFYKKPFVVTIHDLTHTLIPGKSKSRTHKRLAYNLVMRSVIKSAKKIIAVSRSTKNEIVNYFQIPENKIEVIYEAVGSNFKMINKDDAFKYVSRRFGITKPYILFVGVWRRYKNLHNLVAAFEKLLSRGLDLQLVLAGEADPYYPEITYHVSRLPAGQAGKTYQGSIKTLGRVSDDDLVYLYNAANLYVLPSISEGFGLTALEAASCGVPIVCSDIPTLREVMGTAAVYFDPMNVANMAEVLESILKSPVKTEELANAGLRRAQHFTWKKTAEQTIKVYESL